jgi:hypothetical protein
MAYGLRRAGSDWRELMDLLAENNLTARSFDGRDVVEWCRINADYSDAHIDVVVVSVDNKIDIDFAF